MYLSYLIKLNKHEYKENVLQKGLKKYAESKTEKVQCDLISIKISFFEVFPALKCELLFYLLTYFSHMCIIHHEYLEFRFLRTVLLWLFRIFISGFFL